MTVQNLPDTLHLRVPAKINLFLHVTGRRTDGYHLLESIFCPVDLYDDLRIHLSAPTGVRLTGGVPGIDPQDDLTVRAAQAFMQAARAAGAVFPAVGHLDCGIDLTLLKRIPAGAGMGGGSADAAFTLMGLNHLAGSPLSDPELAAMAVKLGADVPFFLSGHPAFVSGIGEILEPIDIPRLPVVIIKPPTHLPTARIFTDPDLTRNASGVKISVFGFSDAQQLLAYVSEHTTNQLQVVAQRHCPDIVQAVSLFENLQTALQAQWVRMTGSGSAVFGVFKDVATARSAAEALASQLSNCVTHRLHATSPAADSQDSGSSWFVWHGSTLPSASLKDQMV